MVEGNTFDCFSPGTGSEVISCKADNITIWANHFERCRGFLTLRTGNNCRVGMNVFLSGHGGIRFFGTGHQIIGNYIEEHIASSEGGMFGYGLVVGGGGNEDDDLYAKAERCDVSFNTIRCNKSIGFAKDKMRHRIADDNRFFANVVHGRVIPHGAYGAGQMPQTTRWEENVFCLDPEEVVLSMGHHNIYNSSASEMPVQSQVPGKCLWAPTSEWDDVVKARVGSTCYYPLLAVDAVRRDRNGVLCAGAMANAGPLNGGRQRSQQEWKDEISGILQRSGINARVHEVVPRGDEEV